MFSPKIKRHHVETEKGNITTDWGDRVGRTVKPLCGVPRAAEVGGAFVYRRHEFSRRGR